VKKYFFLLFVLFFSACGYKPTVDVVKDSVKGNIYIDVPIDILNIKNSILLRESLIDTFANKFAVNIVNNKNMADLFVSAKILNIKETQLESDVGYSKSYREAVTLQVKYYQKNKAIKKIRLENYQDFVVDEDSIINQQKKDEAIKIAIENALLDLPSKIAINSID
jgi:hypothetical protein